MSVKMNNRISDNDVTGTSTHQGGGVASGRHGVPDQASAGRHPITDLKPNRRKWEKELNKIVIECWIKSEPTKRKYRQRMKQIWDKIGVFPITEQRLADQVRQIRRNNWLTDIEIEEIKRKCQDSQNEEKRSDGSSNKEDMEEGQAIQRNDADGQQKMVIQGESDHEAIGEMRDKQLGEQQEEELTEEREGNCVFPEEDEIMIRRAEIENYNDTEKEILRKVLNEIRHNPEKNPPNLGYNDRKEVKNATVKVNKVIALIETSSITETNILMRAAANVVAELVGYKVKERKENRTPYWRRRIVEKQNMLRKELGQLNRMKRNELKNENTISKLKKKYQIEKKGLQVVHEEVQQKLVATGAKLERYDNRTKQYRQNRLFETNQKKLFEELDGVERETVVPDAEESTRFWSEIWDNPVKHKENPEWLKNVEDELTGLGVQENISIEITKLRKQIRKIPNWKSPGPDGVQGYWIKNLNSLHCRIALQLDKCLQENSVPIWMVTGKTVLCVKDVTKGSAVENFRPITCLPLIWKLLTGIIAEELYNYLEERTLLPWEQKGCRKGSRGTKDQLLIDKMILKNCKKRLTSLAVAWIDYRKAYDMVPHSWIEKCMDMFGVAVNVKSFISESMKHWNTELNAGQTRLGNVKIRRGIFQGDSLSPILFVLTMIPLTLMLRKINIFYEVKKKGERINHLLFMDDLKLFAENKDQIDSLVNTVRIFSEDIKMEFGLSKCGVLIMKRGKIVENDGLYMPDGAMMKNIEESGYKYLGVLEVDVIKHDQMKEQVMKEYVRRVRNILKSKLNGGNIIAAINSRAVSIIRYGAGIIKWTKNELEEMDRKTRKLMTMYGAQHPKADIDRLYLKRREGGRGLLGVENCVQAEVNSLDKYLRASEENMLKEVNSSCTLENKKIGQNKEDIQKRHQEEYESKALHGQFYRATEKVKSKRSWDWLRKGYLKKETESTIIAAQDQALCTRNLRKKVYGEDINSSCRVCGTADETVAHIVSECPKLAQKEYKQVRHDNVAKVIHWKLCEKWGFDKSDRWYTHKPEKVLDSKECKILWDFPIQTDKTLEHNRPDITVIEKNNKRCLIIDPSCPFDTRIEGKEEEKCDNYCDLKYEIARIWKMKEVEVIPVVIGALGSVTKNFEKWLQKLDLEITVEMLQKPCLLGTARIIRKVLDTR